MLSLYQNLSFSFIQKHEKKIKFNYLSCNDELEDKTVEYYKNRLNWEKVSEYHTFTFDSAKHFIGYIHLNKLHRNSNCSFTDSEWNELEVLKQSVS